MNDDPFAAFKEVEKTNGEEKPVKKRRGRKPGARLFKKVDKEIREAKIAAPKSSHADDLDALAKIVLLLTPFTSKDQNRILKAVDTLLSRP